jgi:hypothetical protein
MKISLLFALVVLVLLRLAALPGQLSHTPYHDETLMADVLRVVFFRIPIWTWLAAATVFIFSYLLCRTRPKL